MRISILCTSAAHPINEWLERWMNSQDPSHVIDLVRTVQQLEGGDLLLLISCNELVSSAVRMKFQKTLVIHASDLPSGRGWSPHIWQILAGRDRITVTLLEATDRVDSGDIWHQVSCYIPNHALWDEINEAIFRAELELMDFAVRNFTACVPRHQDTAVMPSYYPKRTPDDSAIDPHQSIASQFDLIRVCDPHRFPAFFRHRGHTYHLRIEKVRDE